MSDGTSFPSSARYGKDKVRVFRVVREDIVKLSPHVLIPERFALHLGTHLVSEYPHIHKAFVAVELLPWSRIPVSGDQGPREHPHAFIRDGDEKRIVKVEVDASKGKDKLIASVTAGLSDLLVLKTTESALMGFVRDKYTTLKEIDDRILSTSIDLSYKFSPVEIPKPTDADVEQFAVPVEITPGSVWDTSVAINARKMTLDTFASDNSASIQATLYRMARLIIAQNAHVQTVSYALPNKHYIPVDMGYLGVENLVSAQAEVFMPIAAPSGLITATVSRK
ncbi:hypothetical protein DFH08DRAFT_1000668 [Mycena albidolilacea]|uniref:Uricase n=1 Tax=Mycena albidolilacea TaxID=1033008 RepID=A0AAD7A4B8_9AGAR|nr:hypothetical protein DFH08DRAFT_1000668 [Mycena albidolilacea]